MKSLGASESYAEEFNRNTYLLNGYGIKINDSDYVKIQTLLEMRESGGVVDLNNPKVMDFIIESILYNVQKNNNFDFWNSRKFQVISSSGDERAKEKALEQIIKAVYFTTYAKP